MEKGIRLSSEQLVKRVIKKIVKRVKVFLNERKQIKKNP